MATTIPPGGELKPAAISAAWLYWYKKICRLLEVDPTISLKTQRLPRPWFLFPTTNELTENEAIDLTDMVRSYLLRTKDEGVATVQARLLALSPEASLPFLYLMRYVAFLRGGNRYYWPPFRRRVFSNRLTYDEVAGKLAGSTAELWHRLFVYTQGALYFPKEGSVYIKWPLAHAGLLPDHKETLEEFGIGLLRLSDGDNDMFAETVRLDSDEFILRYQDWLRDHPQYENTSYSLIMRGTQSARHIIAELGQQWLRLHRSNIENSVGVANGEPPVAILPKRRLAYRPTINQMGIIFALGRLKNAWRAQLKWNDQAWELPYRTLEQSGQREFLEQFLPIFHQDWSTEALLSINDGSTLTIAMPSGTQGLIFDSITGKRTKRWHLGQNYYLLV